MKERYIYRENDMTKELQFKEKALSLELQAVSLDHSLHCSKIQMSMHEFLKTSSFTERCHSQFSILSSCCCSLLLTVSSNTLMPSSKSPSSSVNFKKSCPCLQTQSEAQASRVLQWPIAFEFQKYRQSYAPDYEISAGRRCLQNLT